MSPEPQLRIAGQATAEEVAAVLAALSVLPGLPGLPGLPDARRDPPAGAEAAPDAWRRGPGRPGPDGWRTSFWPGGTAMVLLAGLLVLVGAGTAQAHTQLYSTDPADGSTVTALNTLRLVFTDPLLPGSGKVRLSGPPGTPPVDPAVTISGSTMLGTLSGGTVGTVGTVGTAGSLPDGSYTVQWRVSADDGHPITGSFRFTLAAASPSSAVSAQPVAPQPRPAPAAASGVPGSRSGTLLVSGLALVAAALTVGGGVRRSRRRYGSLDRPMTQTDEPAR